ncbi:hypothetical protein [Phenylobacterium sp.]|uniref:hypothetical protein n=1 Tax=Phenylobacterium sp. TaxID=1871053 RepID=UPI0035628FCD
MKLVRRGRTSWAVAASIAAHLGLLIAVLLQKPTLRIPAEPGGPPEAIIPLLILPRTPPPLAGAGAKPAPIQLHRRQQRNLPDAPPVAPLVTPSAKPAEAPVQAPAPVALRPSLQPAPPADPVRATLRTTLGCSEARMAGLTPDDRANCLERLGRGAREAAYLPPVLSADKRALLDQAGAAKLAQRAAAERAAPTARTAPEPADYDGEPAVGGAGLSAYGPIEHKPSKRAAPKLGPLPP